MLGLRKKENIRVRQPLQKLMIPILNDQFHQQLKAVEELILSEVNVKELVYLFETEGIITKKIKPNFQALGKKLGKKMKVVAGLIGKLNQDEIAQFEAQERFELSVEESTIELVLTDVEISTDDIPGMLVASEGNITIALDVEISDVLKEEGLAREFVNRIQNIRKSSGLEVTDKIDVNIQKHPTTDQAINKNKEYICTETLINSLTLQDAVDGEKVEIEDGVEVAISIVKHQ